MKNWLKKGILYGAALAALAGCSIDSNKAVGPESRVNTVEEASSRIRSRIRNNSELEQRVNDALGRMNSARKTAQANIITVPFDAKIADYNNDRNVDFDDFFSFADVFGTESPEYNLVGDNFIDFDDFFIFADQFGNAYNRKPRITELQSDNGNEINVGEEVVLNAIAEDKDEGDKLSINWLIRKDGKDEAVEVNGGVLRKTLNEPGTYEFLVKATDSFGAQSNEMSRILNVVYSGPVLSLPDTIRFAQWIAGQVTGNVHRLNLDDYVSDPNFSDSELTWSWNVENNEFEHTPENTAPYGKWLKGKNNPFAYSKWRALNLTLENNVLEINPVGNYSNEHGIKDVIANVTNPNGVSASKRVAVDVQRNADFDGKEGFDDVVNGGWLDAPTTAYIWVGNIQKDEDLADPRLWSGPKITQDQINMFRREFEKWHTVSEHYIPLEIIEIGNNLDDWKLVYDDVNGYISLPYGTLFGYGIKSSTVLGGAGPGYDIYGFKYPVLTDCPVGIEPRADEEDYAHEIRVHCGGIDHPQDQDSPGVLDRTIFVQGNKISEPSAKDLAVMDANRERYVLSRK